MTHEELLNRFRHHPPQGDQVDRYARVRGAALALAQEINRIAPECREKSLAITKLEEAMFWANAGIARSGSVAGQRGGAEAARLAHNQEVEGSSPSPATTSLAELNEDALRELAARGIRTLRDLADAGGKVEVGPQEFPASKRFP